MIFFYSHLFMTNFLSFSTLYIIILVIMHNVGKDKSTTLTIGDFHHYPMEKWHVLQCTIHYLTVFYLNYKDKTAD